MEIEFGEQNFHCFWCEVFDFMRVFLGVYIFLIPSDELWALKNVSFDFEQSGFIGINGRNIGGIRSII